MGTSITFISADAVAADPDDGEAAIPGRRDLRVSLTSICNLACGHCHNEGQAAPWHQKKGQPAVTLKEIETLIEVGSKHGAKSVKFTGGEPGVYRYFFDLMSVIRNWRARYPNIQKWSMSTNGAPFMNSRKFDALVDSQLTNICFGIDSVEPGELSKPSSAFGVEGRALIDEVVAPLVQAWKGRFVKINVVFTGELSRVLNVIRRGRELGITLGVIEINGVMGTAHETRTAFLRLIDRVAEEFGLEPRLHEPLNEIYLYDTQGRPTIQFYQDHCRDGDCRTCRKLHLRVSPTEAGWGAVPCFLKAQSATIPLTIGDQVSVARFEDAIKFNGAGPLWFKNTPYDSPSTTPADRAAAHAPSARKRTRATETTRHSTDDSAL
jgi:molybdenum cofactor biosynthesis enzyme MoaA